MLQVRDVYFWFDLPISWSRCCLKLAPVSAAFPTFFAEGVSARWIDNRVIELFWRANFAEFGRPLECKYVYLLVFASES